MKTIGLIGGMSWESSAEYYKLINELVKEKLGGFHSAKCILYSVDFDEIEILQRNGKWADLTKLMIGAAKKLELAGADCIVIATNTMHKMADEVQASVKIPLIHIADGTAKEIVSQKIKSIGLLGTKFTMEQDFYKGRLAKKFGLNVLVPDEKDRQIIHNIIYNELCLGKIKASSKKQFIKIIAALRKNGVQGIILGCTEIGLLIKQSDVNLPVFDTTKIHAKEAVDFALK